MLPKALEYTSGVRARDRMARGIGQLETGSGEHLPLQPLDPNTQSRRA